MNDQNHENPETVPPALDGHDPADGHNPAEDHDPADDHDPAGDAPPAPEATTRARAPRSSATTTPRYAAYDTRYARYVGGVYDTKTEAKDAAKTRGIKPSDTRIDEV